MSNTKRTLPKTGYCKLPFPITHCAYLIVKNQVHVYSMDTCQSVICNLSTFEQDFHILNNLEVAVAKASGFVIDGVWMTYDS